ncbi:MAG: hypothetical protein LAT82_00430 [Nanoarchaeota archaeon]|nr:hypothetical protein [Nanoarchaeota archaeon]
MAFGSDSSTANQDLLSKVDTHSKALVSIVERQKDLESKVEIVDEKIELLDHNIIKEIRTLSQDIKHLRDEIHDMKHNIELFQEFQSKVKKQFKITANHDEVQKLERYIDLWNPMQFATREELLDMKENIINFLADKIEEFLEDEVTTHTTKTTTKVINSNNNNKVESNKNNTNEIKK